ncbi:MAG: hypothetical protein H7Y61_03455 [Rhizobiales bacterium]|nr:hypothetical protein [Rhizobacter sp.]
MHLKYLSATFLALASASFQASANKGHDYMMALSDKARNERFTEMLAVLPQRCVVQKNFFRGFDNSRAIWAVGCTDKSAYAIVIDGHAGGSTRILDCKVVLERTKLDCFTKL